MRKSTRETKKTELFHFEETSSKARGIYEEDSNASPDTDEEEDFFPEKPKAAATVRSKKAPAAQQRNQTESTSSSLFGEIGTQFMEQVMLKYHQCCESFGSLILGKTTKNVF